VFLSFFVGADYWDAVGGVLDAERIVVDVGLQGGKRRSGDNVLSLGCSKLFLFCGAHHRDAVGGVLDAERVVVDIGLQGDHVDGG